MKKFNLFFSSMLIVVMIYGTYYLYCMPKNTIKAIGTITSKKLVSIPKDKIEYTVELKDSVFGVMEFKFTDIQSSPSFIYGKVFDVGEDVPVAYNRNSIGTADVVNKFSAEHILYIKYAFLSFFSLIAVFSFIKTYRATPLS
jgi:hypothetical protein